MTKSGSTCFFTGHRALKKQNIPKIESYVRCAILDKINQGVHIFITGGAQGFDMLCARQVLSLRDDYDMIKLYIFLPCINHFELWPRESREIFEEIAGKADKVVYVSDKAYHAGCMYKRNKAIVDASDFGIAYVKRMRSGAFQTVNMAINKGIDVVNIAKFDF